MIQGIAGGWNLSITQLSLAGRRRLFWKRCHLRSSTNFSGFGVYRDL